MTHVLSVILSISVGALIVGVVYLEFKRGRSRRLGASACLIGLAMGVFLFVRTDVVETKGPAQEIIAVFFSYVAMLLGMVAQYGYTQGERGRKRFKFEVTQFLMPIFASPIVFIPLLTITTDMSIGGAFTRSKMMVYLVAFQNGFFWKSFFEQRRQHATDGASIPPPPTIDFRKPVRPARSRAAGAK